MNVWCRGGRLRGHWVMSDCMTVEKLRDILNGLPPNMPVYYQRIEDVYFEKYGWDQDCIKLSWEGSDIVNDYVKVFSAYLHPDKDVLILNAHY